MVASAWSEEDFRAVLGVVSSEGLIDARDQRLTAAQVEQIVGAAAAHPEPEDRVLRGADFRNARFAGDVSFHGVRFAGETLFDGAHFEGAADFGEARFSGLASFNDAWLLAGADFAEASFLGQADFRRAQFSTDVSFNAAQFSQRASFNRAWFRGHADFRQGAFADRFFVAGARVVGDALFTGAAFRAPVDIGPLLVRGRLVLDRVLFGEDATIKASAGKLSCVRTRFVGRADLGLRWAEVVLDDALFQQGSWLHGSPPFPDIIEGSPNGRGEEWSSAGNPHPRLTSLREANVGNLGLANVDMRACRFERAQGLDRLRLEADCEFAGTRGGWRFAQRRTLAEEHEWRAQRPGRARKRWYNENYRPVGWLDPSTEPLEPPQIAALYRSLRKALEDTKDEPGAGDFYYGEMEMRRRSTAAEVPGGGGPRRVHLSERVILWIYWLLSGYGLRASRALTALLVLIALSTAALHLYGFEDRVRPFAAKDDLQGQEPIGFPPTPGEVFGGWKSIEAWTYAAGTATAIIGAPEAQLTQTGRAVRFWLRILSPLLIGLALLAIRGRVKR